jgi:thiamine phosphate synthase YjbQ (UPF0047 family)
MREGGAYTAEAPHISTIARKQVVDLTDQVEAVIRKAKIQDGLALSSSPTRLSH